jgi:membrane protease YdiL (CAAX protease family)
VKKRLVKDRYESIVRMSNFAKIGRTDALISGLIGLFTGLFFICMIKVSFIADNFPDFENYVSMFMNSQSFAMTLIGLAVIGPLFEEIFFRGLLFNILRRNLPFAAALLIQAVFYGYCQPNPSVQVVSFFLALIYGVLYARLHSIWSTLLAAGLMNAVIFVTREYGAQDALANLPDSILLMISGVCLFLMIVLLRSVWKGDSKAVDLRMIGNLFLWTFVYSAVYYPVIFGAWNRGVMSIGAIAPWLGRNNVIGFIPYDIIAFVVYYGVMKGIHRKNLIRESNFTRLSLRKAGLISLLGIAMGVWVQMLFKIPYFSERFPQFDQLTVYLTTAILPVYIAFLVIHSTYKEIFFRAMIYNVFRSAMPVSVSVLGTGVIYGGLFFNWDVPLTIYASLGALIFSLLFEWYRSIWAPIINEICVFAAYYALRKMDIAFGAGAMWALGVSSAAVIGLMLYLWKKRETGRGRGSASEPTNTMVA